MALTKQDLTNISKIVQTQIQVETRKIINGQSAMKSELIGKIDGLEKRMNTGFKEVNKRIDVVGLHLEKVDEDAPTIEEFDKLEKRVTKVEVKIASI